MIKIDPFVPVGKKRETSRRGSSALSMMSSQYSFVEIKFLTVSIIVEAGLLPFILTFFAIFWNPSVAVEMLEASMKKIAQNLE